MAIRYFNDGSKYRLKSKRRVAQWIKAAIDAEGMIPGDINYIFCSSEALLAINKQYLEHDYYTDVITFDYSEQNDDGKTLVNGDIFIDPETVALNASKYGNTAAQEMLRVIIHGILHLCGYKDLTPEEIKIMRGKEDFYLGLY